MTKNKLFTLTSLFKEFMMLIIISAIIFFVMSIMDHKENKGILVVFLMVFSLVKVYVLISKTFGKMDTLIRNNHKVSHILFFSITTIFIINISFTLDYLCVSDIYVNSFNGLNLDQPFFYKFFDLFYFSIVTFTTVGYGDIVPVGKIVKLLTILEMATAFITIVFILSKYTRNHEKI